METKVICISGAIDDVLFAKFVAEYCSTEGKIKDFTVIINSQGGDEHVGRAIAGFMKAANANFDTIGYGDIHSAAVIIFAAGTRRLLSKFATVMVHETSTEVDGTSSNIRAAAKQLERDEQFWCNILAECTGTDAKIWLKLHSDETYLFPDEALKLNLATEII